MKCIKRSGIEVEFDIQKILVAVKKAAFDRIDQKEIDTIVDQVKCQCEMLNRTVGVEEVQDIVENTLMSHDKYEVARDYIRYRYDREKIRTGNTTDAKILSLLDRNNEVIKQENSNKNPMINSVQRDYMAGEVSRDLTRRILLPKEIVESDEQGIIHFHDADYFAQRIHNCDLINLEDMLQNGTVISGVRIDKPHSFSTASNIAMQIVAQVASSQYGGQTISLTHLAPFVQISRENIRKDVVRELAVFTGGDEEEVLTNHASTIEDVVAYRLHKEIEKGVQTIQYQVITLQTTNGQAPFLSVFMYLNECEDEQTREDLAMIIEEVFKQRIKGVKNDAGQWITPAFPKLLYVLQEQNIEPDGKYFYLTELAAKCAAKRLAPDDISEKKMLELKVDQNGNGQCYPCMGCRSFLTPYVDENGKPKYYGRFNQGVVTINLPDVGLSANKDFEKFWKILDERLELCHRALRYRHERLVGTTSDVAPILWQHGALARLKPGEPITPLLYGGYSTLSLGYAGLYECVKAMTGKSHTDADVKDFAMAIMQRLNDACMKWREAENIHYSLYGTPLESVTYKFAKCLQNRFGIIEGITDHNYITNSYHVNVREKIDAFAKLKFESEFQELSPGGAISYVEVPNLQNNIPAVLSIMKYIYNTIMYAEINTKSDFCQVCKYEGEIQIKDDDGKLVWECPNCGCRDQSKMNVARRTCGYIGTQYWNQGRTQEIRDRELHL